MNAQPEIRESGGNRRRSSARWRDTRANAWFEENEVLFVVEFFDNTNHARVLSFPSLSISSLSLSLSLSAKRAPMWWINGIVLKEKEKLFVLLLAGAETFPEDSFPFSLTLYNISY